MWQPYIEIIKVRAPQAVLVFDKFHIVSHLMAAVDQVRRDEIREKGPTHKALMHKTRFIWLKNPWNLTAAQHQRLGQLERLNLKINRAYLLKELFADFWTYRRAGWAKRYLKRWFWWATHSRLPPLRDFAWMLRRHEEDILNYFRMPIGLDPVSWTLSERRLRCPRWSRQRSPGVRAGSSTTSSKRVPCGWCSMNARPWGVWPATSI